MTTVSSTARPVIHHSRTWNDSQPASFACFLQHLDDLGACYAALAKEIRDVRDSLADEVASGRPISRFDFENVIRLSCQISSEDVNNHPEPSQTLLDLVEFGDDLYYDAQRLSGRIVWDEAEGVWTNTEEVVQRDALRRGGYIREEGAAE